MISAAFTDDLLNLAAIVYRPEDDADSLLRDFAIALIHKGHKLGGLVQRNEKNDQHQHAAMELIDLMTGRVFPTVRRVATASSTPARWRMPRRP